MNVKFIEPFRGGQTRGAHAPLTFRSFVSGLRPGPRLDRFGAGVVEILSADCEPGPP